jgi:hypothetical protein
MLARMSVAEIRFRQHDGSPADHERLELHSEALSPARRNPHLSELVANEDLDYDTRMRASYEHGTLKETTAERAGAYSLRPSCYPRLK